MTQWVVSTATIAKTSLEAQIESPSFSASAQQSCVACGSNNLLLVLLLHQASRLGGLHHHPAALQGWVFRHGLDENTLPILASIKTLLSQRRTEECSKRPPPCLEEISLKVAEPPSFQQLEIDFCIGHFIKGIILKRCSKEDEKMWASQEKKRRGREINSPDGAVVKEGAEIAVGLKGVCAPRGHHSLGRNVSLVTSRSEARRRR
ncbi:hypothetical protein LAZ67_7002698 [Cordylochernes scorpioides]|uniref:Uncharacterized protein n=1 Tax=Cordylochernes scorpioides TaxID=51811 RepID=A0ABY6KTF5_9ARAC|nr:hypothetical protein LAZ67_7002698 [Cordylochernes scorpioides]